MGVPGGRLDLVDLSDESVEGIEAGEECILIKSFAKCERVVCGPISMSVMKVSSWRKERTSANQGVDRGVEVEVETKRAVMK